MRTVVVAGNWKMNMTIESALSIVRSIHYGLSWPGEVEVIVAPPFTAIKAVSEFLKDSYIAVGAQNLHWEDKGAFTGEISGTFIKDAGANYVIVGHSERRRYFNETDDIINKKIHAAFRNSLIPVLCIGETIEEREAGLVNEVVRKQLECGLNGISSVDAAKTIIAYEPVWAIGTGKTATPIQAQEVHLTLREILKSNYGHQVSELIRIIYGGSVVPSSSKELIMQEDIDGFLVGGASLKPSDFIEIIKISRNKMLSSGKK